MTKSLSGELLPSIEPRQECKAGVVALSLTHRSSSITTTSPHLLLSFPVMAEAPRRTDGLLSRELNEPPQSSGSFEDIPNIPKVAGDYNAAYPGSSSFSRLFALTDH
jgi:hypothetical protein